MTDCTCTRGACGHAATVGRRHIRAGQTQTWALTSCPRAVLRDPAWQAIMALDYAATISPLSHWPLGLPAGIVAGVLSLTEERRWRQRQEAGRVR